MKKLIKLNIENTTKERKTADSFSELYSYDKNNGSFEFEILNDTLTTEQVTALFKFTDSNKIWKTTGTVEGNKVNVTFDTTLITQNETVICYLYFDEEQRTSDTFRFKFKVKVSEIDKMNRYEVKERFINNTVIVDRLDVVTKKELKEALKNVGGNIDVNGFVTKKEFETYKTYSTLVNDMNLYDYFQQPSVAKEPNKDGAIGLIFSEGGPVVFKGERDGELEIVEFRQLMAALIEVLPHDYIHDSDQKRTFLTDRNFKEMVATPEFKAVVKESLRDIVKEIIKEEN